MLLSSSFGVTILLICIFSRPTRCLPGLDLRSTTPDSQNATETHETHTVSPPNLNSNSQAQANDTNVTDECIKRKLSPYLWNELQMNQYIKAYPHGSKLSLQKYANLVGATNFNFGIGSLCRINQTFDFVPPATHALEYASTSISALFWTLLAIPGVWFGPVGKYYYRGVLSLFYATTAIIRPLSTYKFPTTSHAFTQWSDVAFKLGEVKTEIEKAFMNLTKQIAEAGISTEIGLYGLNLDGKLFSDDVWGAEEELRSHFDEAYRLQTLSYLWRLQDIFIIRGSDPCDGSGENGARGGKNVLSYCTPDGIMMNIVQAKGKKTRTKIFGGEVALSKHGLTTQLLTTMAWECQQQVGHVVEPTTWQNATEAERDLLINRKCMFTLPVCDLTREDIRKKRDSGAGTVQACRIVGKLAI
ncbi:hypothetical protein O181_065628 [Austropuccinia psidii MF-1]|uniref:DUF7872 domain-containing protein n=1 Tax=Austropuccinia psidii MF-1 TaxID=1389203 RepID=A0A9Q3EVP7_9BASI|nr:hypothetical protein [Austropuccinia psidii MF-1]